ncbi:hypothetical protein ABIA69_004732 [Lysinibacillus parviboronicapiens]|uniref:Uncharacterized protein n=1 Tax=Lysinibacillus parviboronicapiens TaxID=436516 RepID=A0ABV2PRC7_9BACI
MSNHSEDLNSKQGLIPSAVTPIIAIHGPYNWVKQSGQLGFLNGQMHSWAVDFGYFFWTSTVTAHPWQENNVQALAVEKLSTAYARTGVPAVNFIVHNVSNGITGYKFYISNIITQSSLKSEDEPKELQEGLRIFAIHDVEGNISEVVTCPKSHPRPFLTTDPRFSMTEIEIPTGIDETELDSKEGLNKLMESYRVEVVHNKAHLLPFKL